MAKLRKMLGSIKDPSVLELMGQRNTQSPSAAYNQLAEEVLRSMLEDFRRFMLPDEPNPANLDWNC